MITGSISKNLCNSFGRFMNRGKKQSGYYLSFLSNFFTIPNNNKKIPIPSKANPIANGISTIIPIISIIIPRKINNALNSFNYLHLIFCVICFFILTFWRFSIVET